MTLEPVPWRRAAVPGDYVVAYKPWGVDSWTSETPRRAEYPGCFRAGMVVHRGCTDRQLHAMLCIFTDCNTVCWVEATLVDVVSR